MPVCQFRLSWALLVASVCFSYLVVLAILYKAVQEVKAYIGRLLGPFCAVLLYSFLGYGPVLAVLALATALVTLTA
eukprot:symbB.v1.2.030510.t1/scaffold3444.1/size68748/4